LQLYQIEPNKNLQGDVKTIWAFERDPLLDIRAPLFHGAPILPDSHAELMINCGGPMTYTTDDGRKVRLPRIFLNRLQLKPLYIQIDGIAQLVSVRLNPWAVRRLPDVPDVSGAQMIPLGGRWLEIARTIEAKVRHYGYQEAIDCLHQLVMDMIQPLPELAPVRLAGQQLLAAGGQVKIADLAANYYLSQSQFERRFKYLTGVSPKTYARLIRFEGVRMAMMKNPWRNIVDLAQDFGYSDQAHFTHEFKTFSYYMPGQFARHLRALCPPT
jgi:AraC-like DNA-binding protein